MKDSKIKPKVVVDAVITWVDGSDKKLVNKKIRYLNIEKESKIQNVKTRYNQVGEIKYVIKSIITFILCRSISLFLNISDILT